MVPPNHWVHEFVASLFWPTLYTSIMHSGAKASFTYHSLRSYFDHCWFFCCFRFVCIYVLYCCVAFCVRAFNCRILYDHYLPTVILIIIGIPSPTHSFTLGLNPSFPANPPYRSLSFFSFKIHYMDFADCLLLLLSISVTLLFSFFCFYTFLVVGSVR